MKSNDDDDDDDNAEDDEMQKIQQVSNFLIFYLTFSSQTAGY
jgi:hypothetical protein